jgi:hypothetical protein
LRWNAYTFIYKIKLMGDYSSYFMAFIIFCMDY